jgi:hypothetical protein
VGRYGYRVENVVEKRRCSRCEGIGKRFADQLARECVSDTWSARVGEMLRDCARCGGRLDYEVVTPRAVVTRDGGDTWAISAATPREAARRAEEWLDLHKPRWREADAYVREIW